MAILEAKNIVKRFGGVTALSDGNIVCREGKITGLLGTNGSGKSTISKIITGVYLPDSGTITYHGQQVSFRNPIEAKKAGIVMAFQNLSLIPDLTVWQNVVLSFEQTKKGFLDNQSAKKITQELIDSFVEGFDIERKIVQLNSSEKQIVEIVKAISEKPKLLILDEPTAALEQAQAQALFKYMKKLAAQGTAIIFTSHRMNEIMEVCDDIVVFNNGHNVGSVDFEVDGRNQKEIVQMITGDVHTEETRHIYEENTKEIQLEVKDLKYENILHGINFSIKKGEVLGIGGLQGQGQTELMLALAGNYKGLQGEVCLNQEKIRLNTPANPIRKGIFLVPGDRQTEGLMMKESIYHNMLMPKYALKKQPFFIPDKKYRKECEEIVELLSIKTDSIDTKADNLSGGNQQKIVVGKWLPFDIKVLLLSDPAKGVDIGAKHDMYQFILKLAKEKEISVILYASDNEELVKYCDSVMVMYEGKIVKKLDGEEISNANITAASLNLMPEKEGETNECKEN
ncbi:sugar ABC transporter ATP-binding protein [Faecalicatena acetigenes]|uniref:Sugar ABC transporter ATP-binding protein n=1 Tax=Faecalicatena acetigenes TaxID=2981790 RepID=A0ABT2TAJ3_9FIRM|nr:MULTISPECIES: sugar ABC transporter ATP-binding protein [Lachnospiraceae]MCU6747302.1 sugar ABC transporter ATP-binding protein [Faecalicatena acetigenes]SCH78586.1 Ribose import ATP-binding protein RbsA [uncultured Clostridium sp.]